ncbi:MAG TPA: phosphodiester glycosidase family protein [Candidatus Nanoarchaeia archaeon]|nr:phosphodiester glycosidase family protein [Candidatus Nanoarchaeia archaeon]
MIKKIASMLALYAGISFGLMTYPASSRQNDFVYHSSPKKIELRAVVSDKLQYYPYFVREAKKQFGSNIEFIVNSTFFDVYSGKSIGKIVDSHKRITNGIWRGGVDLIACDDLFIISDTVNEKFDTKFRMGGLAWLVKDHRPIHEISYNRNIDPYSARKRTAFGVDDKGNLLVYYGTMNLESIARRMDDLDCKDAVVNDGGSSAFFYVTGEIKNKPHRQLKSVIVGVKKPHKDGVSHYLLNVVGGLDSFGFR